MESTKPRKRHCWECRRRYLVCDSTEPTCKRCFTSGIECPGYSDVKPTHYKWLAPGRVTSRGRRRDKPRSDATDKTNTKITIKPIKEARCATVETLLVIPRLEMRTEACALAQAAEYYNSCIYRDLVPVSELGPTPCIYPLSAAVLRVVPEAPDYLLYGMLCMTLSHRINQTRNDPQIRTLFERFYQYWGFALHSLSRHLDIEDGRKGDMAIAGILTLMLTDIQQGTSLNWRYHLEGIHKLIALRGGFHVVASRKSLAPLLLCHWFISVIGNTTCPASDLSTTGSELDALDLLLKRYGDAVATFQMCPLPLVVEIVNINHLRARANITGSYGTAAGTKDHWHHEAYEILERVSTFPPEQWADSKLSSREDWLAIGNAYKAAVALYCVLSLQSSSILPITPDLRAACTIHGQLLQVFLEKGLSSPKTKRSMIWPLVLLGVEAVHGDAATRAFVARQLPELSRDVGTCVPLTAKRVLERFWASGETSWDDCFDRPYAFMSQIAVDTSRLYSVHPADVQ